MNCCDVKIVVLIPGSANRACISGPGTHHGALPQPPCATQGVWEHPSQWGRHLSHSASVCGWASNHLLEHGENCMDPFVSAESLFNLLLILFFHNKFFSRWTFFWNIYK